ncbi:MAG: sulfur carrier protein ThiS [Desulfobacterales bacterium]
MQLTVNGKPEHIENGITIRDLLAQRRLDPDKVVVELNLEIVERDKYTETVLGESDNVEILRFVGGG